MVFVFVFICSWKVVNDDVWMKFVNGLDYVGEN